jgi:hypothetical protein
LAGLTSGAGLMSALCGTIAFLAPEVFSGPYNAFAAGVWSAGVLYSTLTLCNDLLEKMSADPAKRLKVGAVTEHTWMKGAPRFCTRTGRCSRRWRRLEGRSGIRSSRKGGKRPEGSN